MHCTHNRDGTRRGAYLSRVNGLGTLDVDCALGNCVVDASLAKVRMCPKQTLAKVQLNPNLCRVYASGHGTHQRCVPSLGGGGMKMRMRPK